jgi:hypothetical protein
MTYPPRLALVAALLLPLGNYSRAAYTEPSPVEPKAGILSELAVDEVWSGHPVSFALLTERGHQFVAYYDAARRLTVAARRLDENTWTRVQPEGVYLPARKRLSTVTAWDSHNYLALALDRDGHLHLSGNMHNDPLVYFRTTRPFDIATLERLDRMTGLREGEATYPLFFKNAAGELLFRYRDGGSGRGSDIYNRYDSASRTWSNLHSSPLLDGQGKRSAYALDPILGPDGRFHLVWMWRDNPDCSTNHTLSYARSRDLLSWEDSAGTSLTLPLKLGNAEVVDPAPVKQGLINMTFALGFDARERPVVIYHRYDASGLSQAYAARPAAPGGPWDITRISDWDFRWAFSGWSSIAAEVTLGPPSLSADRSHLLVDFSTTRSAGSGRWRLDADTLRPLAILAPAPPALPGSLVYPSSGYAGLEAQSIINRDRARRWVLRWETLPRNRDQPRAKTPPPAALRLYEVPDATPVASAARVGS